MSEIGGPIMVKQCKYSLLKCIIIVGIEAANSAGLKQSFCVCSIGHLCHLGFKNSPLTL